MLVWLLSILFGMAGCLLVLLCLIFVVLVLIGMVVWFVACLRGVCMLFVLMFGVLVVLFCGFVG